MIYITLKQFSSEIYKIPDFYLYIKKRNHTNITKEIKQKDNSFYPLCSSWLCVRYKVFLVICFAPSASACSNRWGELFFRLFGLEFYK